MAYKSIDESNVVPLIIAPVAAASSLDIFEFASGANSLFDFSMSDTIYSLGSGTDLTIAMTLFLGSIAALVIEGQLDEQKFEDEEWYVIAGSFAALPLVDLIPAFGDFVDSTPIVAMTLWLSVSAASVYISYKG